MSISSIFWKFVVLCVAPNWQLCHFCNILATLIVVRILETVSLCNDPRGWKKSPGQKNYTENITLAKQSAFCYWRIFLPPHTYDKNLSHSGIVILKKESCIPPTFQLHRWKKYLLSKCRCSKHTINVWKKCSRERLGKSKKKSSLFRLKNSYMPQEIARHAFFMFSSQTSKSFFTNKSLKMRS